VRRASVILIRTLLLGAGCSASSDRAAEREGPPLAQNDRKRPPTPTDRVKKGSQTDEHGCRPSAGYSWCARTESCVRPWELGGTLGISTADVASWCAADPSAGLDSLTVFTATKIITMEPSLPEASAVAVSDGRIVAVGSEASLKSWTEGRNVTVDRQFEDKILMPGFIDPHVHPSLPAVTMQFPYLAPDDWELPTGEFPGATTPEAYTRSLSRLVNSWSADTSRDPAVPFIAWGYHPLWHGERTRKDLTALFPDQPVMIWHRSFHEIVANDAAIALLGLKQADFAGNDQVNWEDGHFWELGLMALLPKMPFLLAADRYGQGMAHFAEVLHESGVTSVMDMGTGVFGDPEGETKLIHRVFDRDDVPARIVLTPIISDFIARGVSPEQALKDIERWTAGSTQKVRFDGHFKLMMDGAIYSGLSQFDFPGYLDGHAGIWMAPLGVTYEWAETFWNAGHQLHAHTNGDTSAKALIEMVRQLQAQMPRVDHRTTLEHFAYATEDQLQQMASLGMFVSANPYYQYILADVYADQWLGEDRARNMVPLGAAQRAGVRMALHSDSPMAPLAPLTLAWTAVNRTTINGNKNNPSQKLSVHDALRAITIDAAYMMRWEDKVGSIRAGKNADFVVLEQDPYRVAPLKLKDIPIWGTVFEGRPFPVEPHTP